MFDSTTILAYKGKNKAGSGGDGKVTFGDSVLKNNATKIRTLYKGEILAGFACRTEFQKAATVCPDSVRPLASVMVPDIITGTRKPSLVNTSSMATSAALQLSVSKTV